MYRIGRVTPDQFLQTSAHITPLSTFLPIAGTDDGNAIKGSTGAEGWGVFIKLEQELTRDGRLVGIGRWGRSYSASALYSQLAAGHLVLYDPFNSSKFEQIR
jgi:hypothetical protein